VITAVASQSGVAIPSTGTLSSTITSLVIRFSRDMSTVGGSGGANSVTNPANYRLMKGITDVSGSITGITYGFNVNSGQFEATLALAAPLLGGSYQLTAFDTLKSNRGIALDGDGNSLAGGNFVLAFDIVPVVADGAEFRVNTYTPGEQSVGTLSVDGK